MKRRITGFDTDEHGHWRAELDCGHFQHVRHDPPLTTRDWVQTEAGRASRIGFKLDCKRCDGEARSSVKQNKSVVVCKIIPERISTDYDESSYEIL